MNMTMCSIYFALRTQFVEARTQWSTATEFNWSARIFTPDVETHCPIVAEWVGQTCFGRLVELPLPSFLRDLCNGALLCSYSHKRSIRSDFLQFQGVYFVRTFFAGP